MFQNVFKRALFFKKKAFLKHDKAPTIPDSNAYCILRGYKF